jgi:hypothetical protein
MYLKRAMISVVPVICLFGMSGVAAAQDLNPQPEVPGRHAPLVHPTNPTLVHPANLPPGPCRCAAPPNKIGGQKGLPPGPCRCPATQGTPKLQP